MRALILIVLAACASASPVGTLRFKNAEPVWRVADRAPLAARPAKRDYNRALYHTDGFVVRRATRAMEMRPDVRAKDVNALDEVPDSSWFTNRIGVRDLSLDELRRGPNTSGDPFAHRPWRIKSAKIGGMSIGFIFEDARGDKHLLKFDKPGSPEMETAADIIGARILHAIGFNVPEDYVGYIRREDLTIAPGAKLTSEQLDAALAKVAHEADGTIRVLASRFIPGTPIGPYAREGTRGDDKNDVIPHEHRRSLRGQFPIFAWLGHTDLQEDNTLDTFVDGHVEHYLIDFGKALGVMAYDQKWPTVGHTYRFDPGMAMRSFVTLGLAKRTWDGLEQVPYRGVGLFDAEHYDPGAWRPNSFYWPLEDKDRFDAFWGAKLLIRFTRADLAAIVDEAKLTDPRAAQYLVDTLVERARTTARYWFDRVAPLDDFAVEDHGGRVRIAFTDLLLAHHLRDVATHYVVDLYDRSGQVIAPARIVASTADGKATVEIAATDYTIVRLRVFRNAHALPPVVVHLAPDDTGRVRLIGLRRR